MGQQFDFSEQIPPVAFESDGCSGGLSYWWKKIKGELPPFQSCCYDHDREYHFGGTIWEKVAVDLQLALCIVKTGVMSVSEDKRNKAIIEYSIIGICAFIAVTVGGLPRWKKPYSWGFGWHPEWKQ